MSADVFVLPVRGNVLQEVPPDERGPVWEPFRADGPRSWACTLTPTADASRPDRVWWSRPRRGMAAGYYVVPPHVAVATAVEFGCNYPQPREQLEVPEPEPYGFLSVRVQPLTRRRWYGLASSVDLDDDGNGTLSLARVDGDLKHVMRAARSFGRKLPGRELRAFLDSVRGGDLIAAGMLADWLQEQQDPRGKELRQGVQRLVADLFPGVEAPEAKRP